MDLGARIAEAVMLPNSRISLAVAVATVAIASATASLAMPSSQKICQPYIVAASAITTSYPSSKKQVGQMALDKWRDKVTNQFGSAWAIWKNAAQSSFHCQTVQKNGKPHFLCTAAARPCRVKTLILQDGPKPQFDLPGLRPSRRPGLRPGNFGMSRPQSGFPLRRMPRMR
jgi:hypothetical protein